MKRASIVLTAVCICVLMSFFAARGPLTADAAAPAAPTPEQVQAKIAKLIKQLGSEEWQEREDAQQALEEVGEPARKQLQDAAKSSDQEISARANQLLEKLAMAEVTLLITDKKGNPVRGAKVSLTLAQVQGAGGLSAAGNALRNTVFGRTNREQPGISEDGTLSDKGTITLDKTKTGDYQGRIRVDGYCDGQPAMRFEQGAQTRRIVVYSGGTVKGSVINVNNGGKGVPGLQVTIVRIGDRRSRGESRTDSTDANGNFTIDKMNEGGVRAFVSGGNKYYFVNPDECKTCVVDEQTTEMVFKVKPITPEGRTVKIRVLGPDGKPLAGKVSADFIGGDYIVDDDENPNMPGMAWREEGYGRTSRLIEPDKDGYIQLKKAPLGKCDIRLHVEGYVDCRLKDVDVQCDHVTVVKEDVKFFKGMPIHARVLDPKGKPVKGAYVFATDAEGSSQYVSMGDLDRPSRSMSINNGVAHAATNDQGVAEIKNCGPGRYTVRACSDQYGASEEQVIELKPDGSAPTPDLKFQEKVSININAFDKDTGVRIEKIIVRRPYTRSRMYEQKGHIMLEDRYNSRYDGDGSSTTVEAVQEGEGISVTAEGYKPARYVVEKLPPAKVNEVAVKMEKYGKATATLKIVPGKGITAEDIGAVYVTDIGGDSNDRIDISIDSDGAYMGKEIKPSGGVYKVETKTGEFLVRVTDKQGNLLGQFREEAKGGAPNELTITLPGVGKVQGTLCDADGNPVPSTAVAIASDNPLTMLMMWENQAVTPTAITDNDGKFAIDRVPEGSYVVMTLRLDGTPMFQGITVVAGGTAKADLKMAHPVTVTLNLKTPAGEQVPDRTYVMVLPESTNALGMMLLPLLYNADPTPMEGNTVKMPGVYPGKFKAIFGDRRMTEGGPMGIARNQARHRRARSPRFFRQRRPPHIGPNHKRRHKCEEQR